MLKFYHQTLWVNNRKSFPLLNSGKQMAIWGSEKYTVTVFMLSHVNLFLSHFVICHCTVWGSPCYSTWWSDGKWFACQHHHRLLSPSQSLTCSLTQSAQKMTHMYCKGHPSEWWRREALSVGFPCQFFFVSKPFVHLSVSGASLPPLLLICSYLVISFLQERWPLSWQRIIIFL